MNRLTVALSLTLFVVACGPVEEGAADASVELVPDAGCALPVKPDPCTDREAGGRRCNLEAFQTCDGEKWNTHNRDCTLASDGGWRW